MANTYTWSFPVLEVQPQAHDQTDVVIIVNWVLTADNGAGVTASCYGSIMIEFNPQDPFIPYDQLTEAEVQGWVTTAMGPTQVAAYEANLDQNIANQINPPIVPMPPPWNSTPAPSGSSSSSSAPSTTTTTTNTTTDTTNTTTPSSGG